MTDGQDDSRQSRRFGRAWRGLVWATPGQLDAGLSSLATFAAGVIAVRQLDVNQLGAYALLFSALQVAIQIPSELVLIPSQVLAIDQATSVRLGMLRHSLPRGAVLALLAALAVPLGVLPLLSDLRTSDLVALSASASILAVASPVQDHVRSMFHLSDRSWVAALMSGVHFVATAVGLLALSSFAPLWTPFGSLAAGNVASLVFAGIMFRVVKPGHCEKPRRQQLNSVGGWLLTTGLSKTGAGYVARAVLNQFVGTAALGFAEAARIVAQPINVLAMGLIAQIGPRITRASADGRQREAQLWRTRFLLLLAALGVPYVGVTAFQWPLNPLSSITPRAYEVVGLTAAMLAAVSISCVLRPLRAELLGARLQRVLTQVTLTSSTVDIGVIILGSALGVFAVPLGLATASIVGVLLIRSKLRSWYEKKAESQSYSPA